ncbi:MAG TPA: SurA N-terminal domain-containing protein [Stellaceae bacterium]|nr:SurA N-terminal domain-containing protein [Stellaceae bacterium]
MMQAIRTRAGSIIVKVLFGLLIISFGFWGIYTRSPSFTEKSPDTVIATVGDASIRAQDLQKSLEAAMQRLRAQTGGSITMEQVKQLGVLDGLLNQLVDRSLLDQETERLRLQVSDEVVRSTIYENPAFRGPDGRFDRMLFQQVLMMNSISEDELVARVRREIPRSDLLQAVTAGAAGPADVAAALYRYRNEKRVADIVSFPVAAIGDVGQPSDADLTKFYEAHQEMFRAPEYRGFTVIGMDPATLAKTIEIPEDKLRKEYDERKDEFVTPERRDVEQILAPSEDKAKEAEAALAAGKDWKEVATQIAGQDPDTIDLGLMKREELPRLLADIAFELPLNKPSDPVKSPLGWHILRVTKIEAPTEQSFDQVKDQISSELAHDEAVNRLEKLGNHIDDALAGGALMADTAAKFGLTATTIPATDETGKAPDGKPISLPIAANEALKAAFDTRDKETSRVEQTQDGAIFAVHVEQVRASKVRPLTEVKDQVVAAWQSEQKRDKATKEAEALAASVSGDKTLAAVAAQQKLTVTTSPALARRPQQGSKVPPALVGKLFGAQKGETVTADDESGAYVAQLKEIQAPEPPQGDVAKTQDGELANSIKLDMASEFTAALRQRYPVDIKRDALERMF